MTRQDFKVQTQSEAHTIEVAQRMARDLRDGDVVCLHGTLGMGKSVVSRAIIRAICNAPDLDVPSPTFTIVQHYDAPHTPIWHFDLYRLSDPEEVYEIGWEDALSSGIALVEWPQRLGYLMPSQVIDITLSAADGATIRDIEVCYHDTE